MKKKEIIDSFLGGGAAFEGKLTFEGTIRVDGRFKGEMEGPGLLVIGPTGVLEADVRAGHVVCNGELRGRVTATESIEVRVPGKIFGDVVSPRVMIEEGVIFEGNCRTVKKDAPDLKNVVRLSEERVDKIARNQTS